MIVIYATNFLTWFSHNVAEQLVWHSLYQRFRVRTLQKSYGFCFSIKHFFVPHNMLYIMSYDMTGIWYHIAYYIQHSINSSHMLYNITVHIPTLHNTNTVIFKLLRYTILYEWCYMWTRSLKYSIAIWHCFIATYIACYIYSHMAWKLCNMLYSCMYIICYIAI